MDKRKIKCDSHILLVKQLMKPFTFTLGNSGKVVNYLDIEKLEIRQDKIKNIDSVENYYHPLIEEFLDKEIESKFSNVVDKLRRYLLKNEDKKFDLNDLSIIRKFFQYSLIRSKDTQEGIKSKTILGQLMKELDQNYLISIADSSDYIFENKKITLLVNNNKNSHYFICPHNVIYYIFNKQNNKYDLLITINKQPVIVLNLNKNDNNLEYVEISKDKEVDLINLSAYLSEKNHSQPYIVGMEEDLERLILNLNNISEHKVISINHF